MSKKIDYNKWHSGPPPSVGWWPASWVRNSNTYRWWNGKRWSIAAGKNDSAVLAGRLGARSGDVSIDEIEWQHRPASWPARSRT